MTHTKISPDSSGVLQDAPTPAAAQVAIRLVGAHAQGAELEDGEVRWGSVHLIMIHRSVSVYQIPAADLRTREHASPTVVNTPLRQLD